MLDNYEHHPGLVKIGSRVLFREDPLRRSLQAYRIECALGSIKPTDAEWDQACKIALCAASTHLSLVRHFNWVHLAGGAQLAIATRNSLSAQPPAVQAAVAIHLRHPAEQRHGHPRADGTRWRLRDHLQLHFQGHVPSYSTTPTWNIGTSSTTLRRTVIRAVCAAPSFDTPTQENLEALFDVMHRFVGNYLEIYYPRTATGAKAVRSDAETLAWLEELNTRVPNGVGVSPQQMSPGTSWRGCWRASCTW